MIAIATYATKNYCYAMGAQAPLITAALRLAGDPDAHFIMVGDKSGECSTAYKGYQAALPQAVKTTFLFVDGSSDAGNGKHGRDSNLMIARMQTAAFSEARRLGADLLWSVEADILLQPKTLRVLLDSLKWDNGWYDVVMATYPNIGFLGGHGTPQNWILPSVTPDERILTDEITAKVAARKAEQEELAAAKAQPTAEQRESWQAVEQLIENCPPKGNVWELNAAGWKPRGWLEYAYPGIGLGALLPTKWVGVGCTLLNRQALDLANFSGYDGGCTQDLWLCWRAWQSAGLRLGLTTHAICSHVKIEADGENRKKVIYFARHELGGAAHGHLRIEKKDWDGL